MLCIFLAGGSTTCKNRLVSRSVSSKADARMGTSSGNSWTSVLDFDAPAEDRTTRDPAVDPPAVVADLEALSLDGLHEMEVFPAADLAQHDVTNLQRRRIDRSYGAELPRRDFPGHGVAARTERHSFPGSQLFD